MEQQARLKTKSRSALSSSGKQHHHRTEATAASAPTVLTSKGTANTSDTSQVPIQNTENKPRAVRSDAQVGSEPS